MLEMRFAFIRKRTPQGHQRLSYATKGDVSLFVHKQIFHLLHFAKLYWHLEQ